MVTIASMRRLGALNARPAASAVALTVALAVGAVPTTVRAQKPAAAESVPQAREHFRRGVQLYEEDDFRAALIEFNRAYELAPNPAVLYNVGQSYYQLREYAGALTTLEKYLRESGDRVTGERRVEVERELKELRSRVAHVTLSCNVEGAELALDEVAVDRTAPQPLLVGAGRHKLTATKRGYVTAVRVVDVAGGDEVDVHLDLTLIPREVLPAHASPNYVPAVVAGALGVAGVTVGAIFGMEAVGNKSTLRGECNAARMCPPSARDDVDAFSRNTTISTIAFSAGAVGLVAAGYFYLRAPAAGGEAPAQSSAGARVAPSVGPNAAGVVLSGAW
jgi:hypothetical protein